MAMAGSDSRKVVIIRMSAAYATAEAGGSTGTAATGTAAACSRETLGVGMVAAAAAAGSKPVVARMAAAAAGAMPSEWMAVRSMQ